MKFLQVGWDCPTHETYRNLITKLPGGSNILENAYAAIDNKIKQIKEYEQEWLQYQALWDLQTDMLYNQLGEDINMWMKCLKDVK